MLVSTYSDNNVSGRRLCVACYVCEKGNFLSRDKGLDTIVQVSTRFVNFFLLHILYVYVCTFVFLFSSSFSFNWSTNQILTFHPMNWLTQSVQLCGNQPFGYALICERKKKKNGNSFTIDNRFYRKRREQGINLNFLSKRNNFLITWRRFLFFLYSVRFTYKIFLLRRETFSIRIQDQEFP